MELTIIFGQYTYRSVPGKHPWALKHNSLFWPAWTLTRDIFSIRLYRSCYIDCLKCGTWVLTREWALAWDTTVIIHFLTSFSKSSSVSTVGSLTVSAVYMYIHTYTISTNHNHKESVATCIFKIWEVSICGYVCPQPHWKPPTWQAPAIGDRESIIRFLRERHVAWY